jgi:hypothetical protein
MANFAELDENNVVLRVIHIADEDMKDENGVEVEQIGIDFCIKLLGGRWKQTSINTHWDEHLYGGEPFRKNYATIGSVYIEEQDGFTSPKYCEDSILHPTLLKWSPANPHAGWVLNQDTWDWEPPIPMPTEEATEGNLWVWDDATLNWMQVPIPA